jgi:hypothetical protein
MLRADVLSRSLPVFIQFNTTFYPTFACKELNSAFKKCSKQLINILQENKDE